MRLVIATAAVLVLAAPAWATPLATIAGNPVVRSGPGEDYDALGRIGVGTAVTLLECTVAQGANVSGSGHGLGGEDPGWCRIEGVGWVRESFIIGMPAKIEVSPATSLSSPPAFINDSLPR